MKVKPEVSDQSSRSVPFRTADDDDHGTLTAAVNADGTPVPGSGTFSSSQTSTGVYSVIFNRDVSGMNCIYNATITGPTPGLITVERLVGNPMGLVVRTFTGTTEDPASRGFNLTVTYGDDDAD